MCVCLTAECQIREAKTDIARRNKLIITTGDLNIFLSEMDNSNAENQ